MIHDVVILGAGPSGLAIASRLREPFPSALFTDTEHARFWNRRHDKNTIDNPEAIRKRSKHGYGSSRIPPVRKDKSIIVLDAISSTWMGSWREKFKKLNITHLRSPLFFHPDPRDRDGLLGFAYAEERCGDLREIEGVVGREVSKHSLKQGRKKRLRSENETPRSARHLHLDNRDRNDYFTPSSDLFDSYIDGIVNRYDLSDIVHLTKVTDISYNNASEPPTNLFTLRTSTGQTYSARAVILATGPANIPQIPLNCPILTGRNANGSAKHIFNPNMPLASSHLQHKTKQGLPTTVLIVGGGLTTAQVADLLLTRHKVSKVHLVLRSKLKVKHFDVDLPWVAKLRNRQMAEFWSADTDEERFEMLKAARGGGSITPGYEKILRVWEKKGRLEIHTEHELDARNADTIWNDDTKRWNVVLNSSYMNSAQSIPLSSTPTFTARPKTLLNIDHIIFATSVPPSIHNIPWLTNLAASHPTRDIAGLPVLTQDLMWRDDVPLFVTGALAGLRLGPGAGNLGGARLGAERIAWGLEAWFAKMDGVDYGSDGGAESPSEENLEAEGGRHLEVNGADIGRSTIEIDRTEAKGERRDSGYGSEESSDMSSETKWMAGSRAMDLLGEYTSGLGNQFAGLELVND